MSPAAATKTAMTATYSTYSISLQNLINKYSNGLVVDVSVKATFEDYNVRMEPINEDRIEHFGALYTETPDVVPPVFVEAASGKTYRILDGRTRHFSATNLGLKTIRAIIFENVSEIDRTRIATLANLGGPRHMGGLDIKLACDRLLEAGMKAPEIRLSFAGDIPKDILGKALHHAQTDALKRMNRMARKYIADNLTIKEATAKAGMSADQAKAFRRSLSGGKDKTTKTNQAIGMLGQKFKHFRASLIATSAHWLNQHRAGELDSDQGKALYDAWEGYSKQLTDIASTARQKFTNQAQGE